MIEDEIHPIERMKVKLSSYANTDDVLNALLSEDNAEITKYKNLKTQIDAYNQKTETDYNKASKEEQDNIVKTWQRPQFEV